MLTQVGSSITVLISRENFIAMSRTTRHSEHVLIVLQPHTLRSFFLVELLMRGHATSTERAAYTQEYASYYLPTYYSLA